MKNEEFQEEDIWGVFNQREDSDSWRRSSYNKQTKPSTRPKSERNLQESRMMMKSSAPVNVPDWSKIYGTTPQKWCGWSDDDRPDLARKSWDSDDDNDEGNVIPPHQLIASKQLSSFSVFEGAGRTLKGRDLSRVRNAVLTRRAFLNQNLIIRS